MPRTPRRLPLEARVDAARRAFASEHGLALEDVRAVVSPYRICPLGAHSDHQHGPVLGMAIDLHTLLVFAPTRAPELALTSASFPGTLRTRLPSHVGETFLDWRRYALGAAHVLRDRLPAQPTGLVGRLEGPLPGGGLSSSASTVVACLLAIARVNGIPLAASERVALARRVENDHVGVACGILDPASIVGARRGHLLAIDTAATLWEPVPFGGVAPPRFLVVYTGISRNLAGTPFNQRVAECQEAARRLARCDGRRDVELLGDLPDAVFDAHLDVLPAPLARRARHFRGERARVVEGVAAWRRGDLDRFGALMSQSCESSIHCYETGSPELIRLQEILLATPGVLGARFSGAGFGGCGIALVDETAERVADAVLREFRAAFPTLADRARTLLVASDDGARVV